MEMLKNGKYVDTLEPKEIMCYFWSTESKEKDSLFEDDRKRV